MAQIAILGYGTVGSGVFETINRNQKSIDKRAAQLIRIKKVLDLREFPGDPVEKYLTHDIGDILNDNDIKIVVEVMGGVEPAYGFVKTALQRGKSVVTSNKELVAAHGSELLAIARENNLNFLFEASVGGGIPIIRPLNQSLTADEIYEITGILNGTTNYILTRMQTEGIDYQTALAEAQRLGYAERNPDADILGHDACRKLAILLSLAMGKQVDYERIYTEGITAVTLEDFKFAALLNGSIKLIATARQDGHRFYARVSPAVVPSVSPLANVNGVFNAILVKGNVIDEVMFYGKGAGKFPTASAVVADVVDAVKHSDRNIMQFWSSERLELIPAGDVAVSRMVRLAYDNKDNAVAAVRRAFPDAEPVFSGEVENELAFLTPVEGEDALDKKIAALCADNGLTLKSKLRMLNLG